ncbi:MULTISPECIES: 1,4-dihydroxy-2-naphthoate polyprenyltransferase [Micrococcaceae]|uniref:1,4-dihydroxy-2-naphthoate polyprenyltransferase n=1 Tax=unclassified Kocuria TaxID=2649579 RepID=UPI0010130720|nr:MULTISPECIES: 1,4-dihydroxy-2-naphthoate polyprenyltransferase [unclassified Kocuria]
MATIAQWVEGARLRTLPLAVAPVIAGTAAAIELREFRPVCAVLALLVAFFLQVGVNYANDYSDGIKGTDDSRVGPMRLTGSGAAPANHVKFAAFGCFAAAMVSGLALVVITGQWWFLLIGLSAVFAAWGYTGGKHPYGYMGLGDVFVFLYFGLVATMGTTFAQASQLSITAVVASVSMGLIACGLLMANNIRDIPTDTEAGKHTLAVRLGDSRARLAYAIELALAFALMLFTVPENPWNLLVLLAIPLALPATRTVLSATDMRKLIPVLKQTGLLSVLFALLLLVASIIGA